MSGHRHNSMAGTQNQGNSLGDRACVRQSKLYRQHESGNDVKCILGTTNLCWNTEQQEGAYKGQKVFDHNKPNVVSNELRARSNEMKRNFNEGNSYGSYNDRGGASVLNDMKSNMSSNYANDWSTESGSYKTKASAAAPAYRTNDENRLVRGNSGKYNSSDYDQYPPQVPARAANRAPVTSNMGGQSLSQFQSESNAYVQPAPQSQRYGRGSGNSDGFAAALVQPERDYTSRHTGPQYEYKNNIYGHDEAPQRSSKASYQASKSQNSAPYAAEDYDYQYQQSQYRAQYQQPAQGAYDYAPSGSSARYAQDEYQVPGIAPEGANNREGRSTRPW